MKQLLSMLIGLALLSASCTSPSSEASKRTAAARVHEAVRLSDGSFYTRQEVSIRYIDTLYKAGDVIELGTNHYYIVDSFTSKPLAHE